MTLGLKYSKLSIIKENNPSSVEQCLLDSIEQWLQCNYDVKTHGPPSWRVLVAAVDNEAGGGNHALAMKIAEDHKGMNSKHT